VGYPPPNPPDRAALEQSANNVKNHKKNEMKLFLSNMHQTRILSMSQVCFTLFLMSLFITFIFQIQTSKSRR